MLKLRTGKYRKKRIIVSEGVLSSIIVLHYPSGFDSSVLCEPKGPRLIRSDYNAFILCLNWNFHCYKATVFSSLVYLCLLSEAGQYKREVFLRKAERKTEHNRFQNNVCRSWKIVSLELVCDFSFFFYCITTIVYFEMVTHSEGKQSLFLKWE